MTDLMSGDAGSPRAAPARDFDGLYKALLQAHPRDALQLLCGARVEGREVVLDGPTEHPRQRSRQCDKVFLVERNDGMPVDVYHVEVQVKRTVDFEERMVSYWADLALRYRRASYRIHQVVLWPMGGGYPGRFTRDRARLDYRSINVPGDLDPATLLASPLAVQVLEAMRRRGMNDVLEQTESGREIARKNREQGRELGFEEGYVYAMRDLLQATYGDIDDLDALAQRLAHSDNRGNIARIVAGATLAELRD